MSVKMTEEEVKKLEGLNDYLSLEEVETVYVPLARSLYLHRATQFERNTRVNGFLNHPHAFQDSVYHRDCRKRRGWKKHDGPHHSDCALPFAGTAESQSDHNRRFSLS